MLGTIDILGKDNSCLGRLSCVLYNIERHLWHLLEASSTFLVVTTKNVSRHCQYAGDRAGGKLYLI